MHVSLHNLCARLHLAAEDGDELAESLVLSAALVEFALSHLMKGVELRLLALELQLELRL